ncbi:Carbohydrate esterase 4 protein [Tulasnella sp. 424]|nr:Carbohydrate esterase 4 protein [Tulasnella sp. 424]
MTKTDTALTKILVAAADGQAIVVWDFDSGDSVGYTVKQSKDAYKNIANQILKTILTLSHETNETSALQVLPYA